MALCVWPCNCYEKNDATEPDLMWDLDLYSRLDLADAWAIIGPHNWYGPSSNLKLLFDRLVCANGGNPEEALIDHKNPEKAMALEHSPEWEALSVNHLEGRSAAFFCYGDGGGNELGADGRPTKLLHKEWFDAEKEPWQHPRDAYAGLAWQCRYSGVEVADDAKRRRDLPSKDRRGREAARRTLTSSGAATGTAARPLGNASDSEVRRLENIRRGQECVRSPVNPNRRCRAFVAEPASC